MIRMPDTTEPEPTLVDVVLDDWKFCGRASRSKLALVAVNAVVECIAQDLEAYGHDDLADDIRRWHMQQETTE